MDYCDPKETLFQKLKNWGSLFKKKMHYNQYYSDLKAYSLDKQVTENNRKVANTILKFDKFLSVLIFVYIPYSLYSHHKKGYFKTGNHLIEAYIVGKVCLFTIAFIGASFFITKYRADYLLYPFYQKKEKEWEKLVDNYKADKEYLEEFKEKRK